MIKKWLVSSMLITGALSPTAIAWEAPDAAKASVAQGDIRKASSGLLGMIDDEPVFIAAWEDRNGGQVAARRYGLESGLLGAGATVLGSGDVRDAVVITDGQGQAMAVWSDRSPSSGSAERAVMAAKFADNTWGDPVRLDNPDAASTRPEKASVGLAGTGQFVASWTNERGTADMRGLFVATFDGNSWSTPERVATEDKIKDPAIAANEAGAVVITYTVDDKTVHAVARESSTAAWQPSLLLVPEAETRKPKKPVVAVLNDGRFVVAVADEDERKVFARTFQDGLWTATHDLLAADLPDKPKDATIATSGTDVLVAFEVDKDGIFAVIHDGSEWSDVQRLDDEGTSRPRRPTAAGTDLAGFMVAWVDEDAGLVMTNRHFAGEWLGMTVVDSRASKPKHAALQMAASGDAVIFWDDDERELFVDRDYPRLVIEIAEGVSATLTSDPNGINCGGVCEYTFPFGTEVTLTADSTSPAWGGACAGSSGPTCSITLLTEQRVQLGGGDGGDPGDGGNNGDNGNNGGNGEQPETGSSNKSGSASPASLVLMALFGLVALLRRRQVTG